VVLALRELAQREGKSLNEVALRALARALGFGDEPVRHRSLDDVRATWREDAAFDDAIADQHRLDPALWS